MVATTLVYAQVACDYTENLELVLGVENLFNEYSAKNPGHDGLGQLYREDSPFGFNRGTCYLKARYSFYVRSIESHKNLPQRFFLPRALGGHIARYTTSPPTMVIMGFVLRILASSIVMRF